MTESLVLATTPTAQPDRWLIALDIDGTILREDDVLTDPVIAAVRRVRDCGHEVMLATGRSAATTLPVLDRLSITPEYLVCSNGAVTLRRDPTVVGGYLRDHTKTFDPREVLTTIRASLQSAHYAVEDVEGGYRFTGDFPEGALGASSQRVPFDELLSAQVTRVVVISPGHQTEDFLSVVERMGLHKVSYNVGWTAWLDIAPDGVTKATALERVRGLLGIPRTRVMAVGDGRNDIDMLIWASSSGRGVAMGQAPAEVLLAANERTLSDIHDGVAQLLDRF
ncbi:MAG: HAD family hydrolase [Rhodoglobus sp.]